MKAKKIIKSMLDKIRTIITRILKFLIGGGILGRYQTTLGGKTCYQFNFRIPVTIRVSNENYTANELHNCTRMVVDNPFSSIMHIVVFGKDRLPIFNGAVRNYKVEV